MIVTDPDTGELVGPASEVEALLDGAEVSRSPAFRVWTEGGARRVSLVGNATAAVLVTDRPGGRRALLPAPTAHAVVALVVWLDLRPRPVPAHPPVLLAPGALAVVIGRGEAHGHGLDPDVAADLQQRLGCRRPALGAAGRVGRGAAQPRGGGRTGRDLARVPGGRSGRARTDVEHGRRARADRAGVESEPIRGPMMADRRAAPSD